ncbi:putative serine esterase-domain-containing protein [Zopfochytrium polystomum]|nr:putative serine esterase-domain-containing protein [Zopfochytrium polystomum]
MPSPPSAPTEAIPAPVHLFVLQNGLWGSQNDLAWLADQIVAHQDRRDRFRADTSDRSRSEPAFEVLSTPSNEWIRTYDGVDECGGRLAQAVISRIRDDARGPVSHISFVGYSLGGVIARYAIGVLYAHGYLRRSRSSARNPLPADAAAASETRPRARPDAPEATHFCTFASPHLGSSRDAGTALDAVFNSVGAGLTGRTGAQLLGLDAVAAAPFPLAGDAVRDAPEVWVGGRPMIEVLADPRLPFWIGLSMFATRTVYGNILNDPLVPLATACILPSNPYLDITRSPPGTGGPAPPALLDERLYRVVAAAYPSIVEPNPAFPAADHGDGGKDDDESDGAALRVKPALPPPSLAARLLPAVLPFVAVVGVSALSAVWLAWRVSRSFDIVADADADAAAGPGTSEPDPAAAVAGAARGLAWIEEWAAAAAARRRPRPQPSFSPAAASSSSSRDYACAALDLLAWRRCHVLSSLFRAHASIVRREPGVAGNEDVVLHFLDMVVR